MQLRPSILALSILSICAGLHADDRTAVATRYGMVSVIPASEERSALLFRNKPLARMNGDASLYKLSIRAERDYVLADAMRPGLDCKHEFLLLDIGAEGAPAVSAPFGHCMTLFGARLQDGKAVVQLAESPAVERAHMRVHEFSFEEGKVRELPGELGYCEATARAAGSEAVGLSPDAANKVVDKAGRAWFHSAPDEECRTPKLFLVPGDRVEASRETGAFVEVQYRHPRTGVVTKGWIRRDRLLDPAQ
jgi:hypothetical protein